MKKFLVRLVEVVCVVLLVVFIAFVSSRDKISTVPFKEVSKHVLAASDIQQLSKRDKLEVKRTFSIDTDAFDGFIRYSGDSVTDVRELLILFSEDGETLSDAEEKINAYAEEKMKLFEGYAPKESKLISSRVLTVKKGYLLYYIGDEKEKVLSAFSEVL